MSLSLLTDDELKYTPPVSLTPFFLSDKFVNLVVGPVGSTKTTASILKIAHEAARVAPCRDGLRRSRTVWIRQTREQLRDTSIPDFLKWYPDGQAGSFIKSEGRFILKFADVEAEVLFRGLDDSNDVRRLLSLQASFAVADEFRELNMDIFKAMQGRLGRYPDKSMNGVGCADESGKLLKKFWGASNPPDFDTPWEQFLTNPPENAAVFFQPSALSPEADWLQFLDADYYTNLAEGKDQDWIDIYIHAKFGRSLSGRPVHPGFNHTFHVAKSTLTPHRHPDKPLLLGFDFGLTPACAICQVDLQGRLLVLEAVPSEGMGLVQFLQRKLKPVLAERFAGYRALAVGDPAGRQRVQTDERSCFEVLKQEGFKVIAAPTNSVVARIAALDKFLSRQVDGGPGFLIDPRCTFLIKALRGNYRYKVKQKTGEFDEKPEKNDASHIAEALQYAALQADAASWGYNLGSAKREVKKVSARGWT